MLKLIPHLALESFLHGDGGLEHWNTLAFRLHIASELAWRHSPNVVPDFQQAIPYLDDVRVRGLSGSWALTHEESLCIGTCLWYADRLQEVCTRAMQKEAGLSIVRANINRLHRIGLTSREQAERWAGK